MHKVLAPTVLFIASHIVRTFVTPNQALKVMINFGGLNPLIFTPVPTP